MCRQLLPEKACLLIKATASSQAAAYVSLVPYINPQILDHAVGRSFAVLFCSGVAGANAISSGRERLSTHQDGLVLDCSFWM